MASDRETSPIEQAKLDKARRHLAMAMVKKEYDGWEYVVGLHVETAYNALGGTEEEMEQYE